MKNIQIILLILLGTLYAQVSLSDIDKIGNQQLDAIRQELQSFDDNKTPADEINIDNINSQEVEIKSEIISSVIDNKYFGYNYFQTTVNFFDNMPAPSDFKLGSGDEIILSLWGETNSREKFVISKEGLIYYKNIGFINLSNKTVKEAEMLLINELSTIYSTLKDDKNSTKLMVELGKLKSLNIYFSGEVFQPGIHLVHPFSDIFVSLVQSGGVNQDGSLRNIQLIRDGNIISEVDFYAFFNKGSSSFSNIRLIDGDTIYVPAVRDRIEIRGAVVRPGYYEILPNEKVTDVISYAAGLKARASSTITIDTVTPAINRSYDDNAISSLNLNLKNAQSASLNNGDVITIREIGDVDSKIEIFGRIKSPGKYSAINMSLKDILDIAGGFDDPIFRKTILEDSIIILRRDKNQFYSKEIAVDYKNADQFKLEVNDKIFVYEDVNYNNNYTYRVEGEIFRPGTYPISQSKLTVRDALSLAGGLTSLTTERNITVKQEFTELDDEGNEVTTSEPVNNVSLDFEIGINSVIIASPFENVVRIEGNVYNPGLVTYTKGYRYPRYIELAGGYRPNTLKSKTYIKRANGNIEQVRGYFISRGKNIYPGDTIVVSVNPDPSDFDITAFISDISTTLANIAAILLIVDNQTN
jgi:protein involved in polysaccharide export with SLBB domain